MPPAAAPPLPEFAEATALRAVLEEDKKRLDAWKAHIIKLEKAGGDVVAERVKFMEELVRYDKETFRLYSLRSHAEQQSERDLRGRGMKLLPQTTLFAFVDRVVKLTHVDEAGDYWYRSVAGGLERLPDGQMTVDTDLTPLPTEWMPDLPDDDSSEEGILPFVKEALAPKGAWGTYGYLVVVVILLIGIMLIVV